MDEIIVALKADGFQQQEGSPCHWIADWDEQEQFFVTEDTIERWDPQEKTWYEIDPEWLIFWLASL